MLVRVVINLAVGVIMVLLIEGGEEGKITPVTCPLVAHVVGNTGVRRDRN